MVQLPATSAIEYVAAGHFFPGGLLAGGTFGRVGGGAFVLVRRDSFRQTKINTDDPVDVME